MATTTELSFPNTYNRELILDLTLQAFTVYNFDHESEDASSPKVHDYMPVGKTILEDAEETVLDNNGVAVTDAAGDDVTIVVKITSNRTTEARKENFKYLTTQGTDFTVSEYKDFSFTDWVTYDGTGFDFSSYLLTGYEVFQDLMRTKQAVYLIVMCDRTETFYTLSGGNVVLARQSSCLVQSQWDWNTTNDQGKFGTQFEAYRLFLPQPSSPSSGDAFNYGPRVVRTKNKLRGHGESLSIRFDSSTGKDLKLLGWGIEGVRMDNP